jgi:peptidoglycan/LPS O-acetylase OafA/YrhL
VFFIFRHELRWYHAAAAALYLANFDFAHPWFLGHLWSLSVEEQFYFLWPGVLKKWWRHRVGILAGVVAFVPVYRVGCHLLGLHGRADETFPAVADVLAVGCLLAVLEHAGRIPTLNVAKSATFRAGHAAPAGQNAARIGHARKLPHFWQNRPEMGHPTTVGHLGGQNPHPPAKYAGRVGQPGSSYLRIPSACVMLVTVILVPVYVGRHHFHLTPLLLFVLWPAMHVSIAGLLKFVVEHPYGWLNARPVVWLGRISYSLYLWQQVFIFGKHARPWYYVFLAVGMAGASFYLVERPTLWLREMRAKRSARTTQQMAAA